MRTLTKRLFQATFIACLIILQGSIDLLWSDAYAAVQPSVTPELLNEANVSRGSGDHVSIDFRSYIQDESLQEAILEVISIKPANLLIGNQFAVTSIRRTSSWLFISIASLDGPDCSPEHVGAGNCGKLILASKDERVSWHVALAGTKSFSALLSLVPDSVLSPLARQQLDPLTPPSAFAPVAPLQVDSIHKFPWPAGDWIYTQGWHDSAVDIGTSGDDKRVLASAGGTITNICRGSLSANVTIRHDDGTTLGYFHINISQLGSGIAEGNRVQRGQVLGALRPGTWSDLPCGLTDQNPNFAHVHWVLPTEAPFMADGWTIQYPNSTWRKDGQTRIPGQTLTSTNIPITPSAVDVYLIVDLSGSFADDLPVFQAQAPDLINNLKAANPNTRFGLARFEDYPIDPFGDAASGDKAYERLHDLTFDSDAVLSTIAGLSTRFGADGPQSQLVALYQAATGEGQDLSGAGFPGASIPSGQQASFRDDAVKLFLLWTDAPFHRPGDPGDIPYPGPSFDETVDAILALDPPKVIGISSGTEGVSDLEEIARRTGALAPAGGVDCDGDSTVDVAEGEPMVCGIASSGVGIGDAIEAIVEAAVVLPIADADGPYTGVVGEPIAFDGSGSFDPDGTISLYEWDFESDGVFDFSSVDPTATHTYTTEFSGTVTLRVTDDDGNTGTDTAPVRVEAPSLTPTVAPTATPTPTPTSTPRPVVRPVGGYGESLGVFELLLPWLTLLLLIGVTSVGVLLLRRRAV